MAAPSGILITAALGTTVSRLQSISLIGRPSFSLFFRSKGTHCPINEMIEEWAWPVVPLKLDRDNERGRGLCPPDASSLSHYLCLTSFNFPWFLWSNRPVCHVSVKRPLHERKRGRQVGRSLRLTLQARTGQWDFTSNARNRAWNPLSLAWSILKGPLSFYQTLYLVR
jgi:hypothetical protein